MGQLQPARVMWLSERNASPLTAVCSVFKLTFSSAVLTSAFHENKATPVSILHLFTATHTSIFFKRYFTEIWPVQVHSLHLWSSFYRDCTLRKKFVWHLCMFYVHLCQDRCCFGIICGLMTCAGQKTNKKRGGDRLNIVFSPDVILCGWLGSKYQLTNPFRGRYRCDCF